MLMILARRDIIKEIQIIIDSKALTLIISGDKSGEITHSEEI